MNRWSRGSRFVSIMLKAMVCMVVILFIDVYLDMDSRGNVTEGNPKIVRVGYYANDNFQEGAAKGEVKSGYCYEYLQKLATLTGWKYDYVYGSWSELYEAFLKGDVDLMAGLAYNEERANQMGFSKLPMGKECYYLFKNVNSDISSDNLSSLNNKKIGALKGQMYIAITEWLSQNNINAEVILFDDLPRRDEAIISGKIDAIIAEDRGISSSHCVEAVSRIKDVQYFVAITNNRKDLLDELNEAQDKMRDQNPYYPDYLSEKYFRHIASKTTLSDGEKQWIAAHDSLRIGYLNNFIPYSDTDMLGNATGVVKDILPEMMRNLHLGKDLDISYKGYDDYKEMLLALSNGELDAIFPVYVEMWVAEENNLFISEDVFSAEAYLVQNVNNKSNDVKKIAVVKHNLLQRDYSYFAYPNAELVYVDSVEECLQAVEDGRVDTTIISGLRAGPLITNGDYTNLGCLRLEKQFKVGFAVQPGNISLLALLNRGISIMDKAYPLRVSYDYEKFLHKQSIMGFMREHVVLIIAVLIAFLVCISIILVMYVNSHKRQKRAAIALQENYETIQEQQKALELALERSECANRAKTSFLNSMSHDIRTPMNAIIGFTNLAKEHIGNTEQVKDYLSKIGVSSKHLLSLINDVLDMSRIESGKVNIEEENVKLSTIAKDLKTLVQEDMNAKNLHFSVNIRQIKNDNVVVDKLRLNQVLLNILSNAMKFTEAGGNISLEISQQGIPDADRSEYKFSVKDNGIGMSKEFQQHIFEPFTREKTSTVSGIQGTGLGMSITKKIVDMIGGRISVDSEMGKGTEVTVHLYLKNFQPDEETPAEDISDEAVDFSNKRILVVEDNELNQEIITEVLTQFGFMVDVANDGTVAVEKMTEVEAGYYDLILMDLQMPVMNGYDATRAIRKLHDERKASITIWAMSADAFNEDKKVAWDVGMNGFIPKPFDVNDLYEKLKKELNK